jgi:hypothetical protein
MVVSDKPRTTKYLTGKTTIQTLPVAATSPLFSNVHF